MSDDGERPRSQSVDVSVSKSNDVDVEDRRRAASQSATGQYVPHRFFLRSDLGTYWTLKVTPNTLAKDICEEVASRLALDRDTFRLAFIGQFQRMEKENVIPSDMNLWNKMRQMAMLITAGKVRFVVIEKDKLQEALGRAISLDEETLAQKVSDPLFNEQRSQQMKAEFMKMAGFTDEDVERLKNPGIDFSSDDGPPEPAP